MCHGGVFGDKSPKRFELRRVVAGVESDVGVTHRPEPVVGRDPQVGWFEVVVRQTGLRHRLSQRVERCEQSVAVGVADKGGERFAFGGQLLQYQIAGALCARSVGIGQLFAQHPPRKQELGGMVFEALRRRFGQPVRQRRKGTQKQVTAVAERTLRFGEEGRTAEPERTRFVLIEAGFAQRAKRRAGRQQPFQKVVDRGEHGYWRFTLIDPTLRIESSSVIDAL